MDSEKKKGLFRSGAGVIAAIVILLLFVLTALYLKSLIFGIIAAYFFLPLEKFFERMFQTAPMRGADTFFRLLLSPVTRLRRKLAGEHIPTEEEKQKAERNRLVMKSTGAMFIALAVALVLILFTSANMIIPAATNAGKSIKHWATESPMLKQADEKLSSLISEKKPETNAGGKTPTLQEPEKNPQINAEEKALSLREFAQKLRTWIHGYVKENRSELAQLAFSKGRGLIGFLLDTASRLGTFAFDLLLFFFFFLFFTVKMASFGTGGEKSDIGRWCVHAIFNSPWMPKTSDHVRNEAAEIINSIALMFNRWVRGYISIVLIETAIYTILFSAFSVPNAFPLAFAAGMTIFLPFIGPLASFALTVAVCLCFCETHLIITLIGVCLSYLLINGLLEQLFLYPTLVGGAIGLTTLETIIVVLLGGLLGGITGMILSVPAAAVLKFLIPKIYRILI